MVSFAQVPSNLRVPFVTAEFNSAGAVAGPVALAYRGLLIGQRLASAPWLPNSLHLVTSADQVATGCGRGSMAHREALAWFSVNPAIETWVGVLADDAAAVQASGTITITGPASGDGTLSLYLGGNLVNVAVASGDTASTIAANIATAIGKRATGTVTCAAAQAADTVTVAGVVFVGTAGAVVPGAATFSIDTGNNQTATSLAAQINAHATASAAARAKASSAVVTVTSIAPGTGGNAITLTSSNGTRLAVTGAGTLAGATAANDLPVYADATGAVATVHAVNAGLVGNEIDVRYNFQTSEQLPAGLAVAVVAMSGGTTNPALAGLIAAMGDSWYHVWVNPFTDATSLTSLENELLSRAGPMRMIDGVMIAAKRDTYSTVATLGQSRNSPYSSILRMTGDNAPAYPPEFAANAAVQIAISAQNDPAVPFQTLALAFVKGAIEADRDTILERNGLLYDGIATSLVGPGDQVQIERPITTYRLNAAGSPDVSYLDLNTPLTLMYLRYSFRVSWANKYPRAKIADDGTRFAAGQSVVTPKSARAHAVTWFQDMESLGLVEDIETFKANLIVERDPTNRNRINFFLPPNLVNQLMVTAAQIGFLL